MDADMTLSFAAVPIVYGAGDSMCQIHPKPGAVIFRPNIFTIQIVNRSVQHTQSHPECFRLSNVRSSPIDL
jgi:hypothetical protein